jgi:hypothetical protein
VKYNRKNSGNNGHQQGIEIPGTVLRFREKAGVIIQGGIRRKDGTRDAAPAVQGSTYHPEQRVNHYHRHKEYVKINEKGSKNFFYFIRFQFHYRPPIPL